MHRLISLCVLISAAAGKNIQKDRPSSIVNGELASIEDFPYYAFLGYGTDPEDRSLHCGGSIIAPNIILTAAHCLRDTDLKVYVGIQTLDDLLTATPYDVEKILPHPEYMRSSSTAADVGLIKLARNITFDHVKVEMIKVAHDNPPIGVETTVVGFGMSECVEGQYDYYGMNRCSPEELRYAVIKVVKIAGDNVIYTRGPKENTCYGDSGGPIVYDGAVIGVVSSGEYYDCTGYDTQGPIPPYYYWIKKHMRCM